MGKILFFLLLSLSLHSNAVFLKLHYTLKTWFPEKNVPKKQHLTWLGQDFPEEQWNLLRNIFSIHDLNPTTGDTIEVIDLEVRKSINEEQLKYDLGKIATDQIIKPIITRDFDLIKKSFENVPRETAIVRLHLDTGETIHGKIVLGGYRSVSKRLITQSLRSAQKQLALLDYSPRVIEVEMSHTHPFVEFINITKGNFHLSPLSFNDLTGNWMEPFRKSFPEALLTVRAIVTNGYAYEESHDVIRKKRVPREEYWIEKKLDMPKADTLELSEYKISQGPNNKIPDTKELIKEFITKNSLNSLGELERRNIDKNKLKPFLCMKLF